MFFKYNFFKIGNRNKRRFRKRRRGSHLRYFFFSRKKKFSLYYLKFDSRLVKINQKIRSSSSLNISKKGKYRIGLKSVKLKLIREMCLRSVKFCTQRYLRSLKIEKYFKNNVSIIPDYMLTSKSKSVRMGKGKGEQRFKIFHLKKSDEIYGVKFKSNFKKFIISKKLYFFKYNFFILKLLNIVKSKPSVKNIIFKKVF